MLWNVDRTFISDSRRNLHKEKTNQKNDNKMIDIKNAPSTV